MPYSLSSTEPAANFVACEVCGDSSVYLGRDGYDAIVDCLRCGDYRLPRAVGDDFFPIEDGKCRALVSHLIRKMYRSNPQQRVILEVIYFSNSSIGNYRHPQKLWKTLCFGSRKKRTGDPA